jgi:hypothetical protein
MFGMKRGAANTTSSIGAFLKGFFLCCFLIIVFCLFSANRQDVTVGIDPFSDPPRFAFSRPLYQVLFISFFSGMFLGGLLIWFQQKKYRRVLKAMQKDQISYNGGRHIPPETFEDPI